MVNTSEWVTQSSAAQGGSMSPTSRGRAWQPNEKDSVKPKKQPTISESAQYACAGSTNHYIAFLALYAPCVRLFSLVPWHACQATHRLAERPLEHFTKTPHIDPCDFPIHLMIHKYRTRELPARMSIPNLPIHNSCCAHQTTGCTSWTTLCHSVAPGVKRDSERKYTETILVHH